MGDCSRGLQKRNLVAGPFTARCTTRRLLVDDIDFASLVDLQRIDAQTLIVNGRADPIVDWTTTPETAARFRSASFEIVDAGHFLHFERPEILDTYASFLTAR